MDSPINLWGETPSISDKNSLGCISINCIEKMFDEKNSMQSSYTVYYSVFSHDIFPYYIITAIFYT